MVCLDKYGWPVIKIKGRRVVSFIRLIMYTRKIRWGMTYKEWVVEHNKNWGSAGGAVAGGTVTCPSKKAQKKDQDD